MIFKVSDNEQSFRKCLEACIEAQRRGAGIKIDVTDIPMERQVEVVRGIEAEANKVLQQEARRKSCQDLGYETDC